MRTPIQAIRQTASYSTLQLNEVQNQELKTEIIILSPASKSVSLYFMQTKTAVYDGCAALIA
ncbi:hypothetical protein F8R90_18805 [Nostoc sp. NZL]|nr:hypothetical protein [Nostoc sp. NZL]